MEINTQLPQAQTLEKPVLKTPTSPETQGAKVLDKAVNMKLSQGEALNTLVKELLSASGIKMQANTLELAKALINNQMPVNKEHLQKLNQLTHLFNMVGENSPSSALKTKIDKGLFMMEKNIPTSTLNAKVLEQMTTQNKGIAPALQQLARTLTAPNETLPLPQKLQLLDALMGEKPLPQETTLPQAAVTAHMPAPANAQGVIVPQMASQVPVTAPQVPASPPSVLPPQIPVGGTQMPANIQSEGNLPISPLPIQSQASAPSPQAVAPTPVDHQMPQPPDAKAVETLVKNLINKHPELSQVLKLTPPPAEEAKSVMEVRTGTPMAKGQPLPAMPSLTIAPEPLTQLLLEKFALDFSQPREEVEAKLNETRENVRVALEILPPEDTFTRTELTTLRETLAFTHHLKDSVYIPLPLVINNTPTEGELYVFNKGGGGKGKEKETLSAVILLNTLGLGKVETFIKKTGMDLNIQFRVENEGIKNVFRTSLEQLSTHLGGYHLRGVTLSDLETPFSIVAHQKDKGQDLNLEDVTLSVKA